MQVISKQIDNKEKLHDICLWIRANVDKQIGWEELTKHSNLSHNYLIQLFKSINTTPMSYVRKVKDEEKKIEIETAEIKLSKNIQNKIPVNLLKQFN